MIRQNTITYHSTPITTPSLLFFYFCLNIILTDNKIPNYCYMFTTRMDQCKRLYINLCWEYHNINTDCFNTIITTLPSWILKIIDCHQEIPPLLTAPIHLGVYCFCKAKKDRFADCHKSYNIRTIRIYSFISC